MSRENEIELTDEIVSKLEYSNIIAVTIAEGGAMGDPGGLELVDKDLNLYHTNLGYSNIDTKQLLEKLPVLASFKAFFGHFNDIEGWKCIYMGFGNYLLIRENLSSKYQKYLDENFKDGYDNGQLYSRWYGILKQLIKE